jgi:hypothetical protein
MSTSIVDFDAAADLLRGFDVAELAPLTDADLLRLAASVESVGRLVSAAQVAAAAEIASRSRHELGTGGLAPQHGCVRVEPFLEKILRISGAEAHRRVQLGAALRPEITVTGQPLAPRCPSVAAALAAGDLGIEAAAVIVRTLDEVRRVAHPGDLDVAEAGLAHHARTHDVAQVSALARAVRDRLDPDGVRPREEETLLRRGVSLGRERNGVVPIRGGLAPTTAALLKAEFDEANAPGAQPRFLSDHDRRNGTTTTVADDGTETITVRDTRSREQRQHDVLGGVLQAGIRNTGLEAGQLRSTAEVTAHISIAELESGVGAGWIDGILEPVSVGTIERLACDGVFRRAVLGNDGEVLALGKARYPFSSAQRKAVVLRDGDTCLLCDTPATWSDAHHVVPYWTYGALGKTDVDNCVLFCGPHHDFIHHSEWKLSMIGGLPHLLAPPEIDPSQTWKRVGGSRVRRALAE